jgi:uncharacterized membrane protein YbaN (DUF454 family)
MKTLKQIKKIIVAVVGFTVLIIGLIMVVLPGPAIVVIPLGLTILASEFVWARHWLIRVKATIRKTAKSINGFRKNGSN